MGPKQYDENPPLGTKLKLFFLRLGTWFLSLAIIAAAIYLIVFVTEHGIKVPLILPLFTRSECIEQTLGVGSLTPLSTISDIECSC